VNQLPSDPEVVELSEPVSQIDSVRFAVEMHRAYRKANRPYRRAFRGIVSGERDRKILLAVGVSNAKARDEANG
jgi:hypothetical protein